MSSIKQKPHLNQVLAEHQIGSSSVHGSRSVVPIATGIVVLLVVVLAGLAGAWYATQDRQASIAGVSFAEQTTQEALSESIESATEAYKVAITYPDGSSKQVSLSKLGLSVDAPASASAALSAQNPSNLLDKFKWWQPSNTQLVLTINEDKLDRLLRHGLTKKTKPYKNARVLIAGGKVKLIAEKSGEGYALANGRDQIVAAAQNLQTTPLSAQKQTLVPPVTTVEAEPVYKQVKTILAQNVTFKIDGQPIKASADSIGKWLELTTVESAKTIDLSVNSGKVLKYINEIAAPYVQPPRSEVVIKKADGSSQVLVAGKSGIDVVRKESLATSVAKKVLTGEGITADAPVKYAAYKSISAKSYPKWLVVDTSNKRMYAYAGNKLVRTFLISAGAPQTPTVLGTYAIRSKVRIQDMRGNNVDGSRYFQPDVEYVNYFYADYAIHGNYWRPTSYFGNVNSSHGCVGIVNSDAAWIYSWAPIGTPVIVHS